MLDRNGAQRLRCIFVRHAGRLVSDIIGASGLSAVNYLN